MPTVISYDSPAIALAMGADVGLQRGNQENFQNALQTNQQNMQQQQMVQANQARMQQMQIQAQGMANQANAIQQQAPQPSPAMTTGGMGQPTIYQPQGAAQVAPQQVASMLASQGQYSDSSGLTRSLPHNQQAGLSQLDSMHQNGMLDDFEYNRRKGILLSGGDAFSEPTAAERQHERMQQSAIETMHQQNQDKAAGEKEKTAQQKEAQQNQRQSILDQVKVKEARLKDPLLDDGSRKALHGDLDDLGKQLKSLNEKHMPGAGSPGGQLKPTPRALMPQLLQAAGGDVQKAKELAKQHGFDPDQIQS